MYTIRELARPATPEEALALLERGRGNVVLGGGCWLALGKKAYDTGIDLSRLGFEGIYREGGELVLGGSATLGDLERSREARTLFSGLLSSCVKPIVGVQLRNSATVGGSLYARFGFSDLLTALLVLNGRVELCREGMAELGEFAARSRRERDIVKAARLKIEERSAAMETMRLTATDLPLLTAAVSRLGEDWRVAVGARPARPVRAPGAEAALRAGQGAEGAGRTAAGELVFGTDLRASGEYRAMLCQTLVARCVQKLERGEGV